MAIWWSKICHYLNTDLFSQFFMFFDTDLDFTQCWVDGRPGNACMYTDFPHSFQFFGTPETMPLGLHPQCLAY